MSLIVHARYVFRIVSGKLSQLPVPSVSSSSVHACDKLRATRLCCLLYCKNLNDIQAQRERRERGARGKLETCRVPSPYPLSYPFSSFVHLCKIKKKKSRLSPHFMAIHLGYLCMCVCECAAQIRVS